MQEHKIAMSSQPSSNPRFIAWHCLQRWGQGGIFAETLVQREAASCSRADRALVQAIVYGTLRQLAWLDHLRRELRPGRLEEGARWLVLSGLCQLFVLEQSDYAAVNETVGLAPARVRGVVNGMLRSAVRRREEFREARRMLPPGIRYSTPSWLVKRWLAEFGEGETEAMLAWNIGTPPLYARLNPLNPMAAVPADWQPLPGLPLWYRLPAGLPEEALHAGQVYVADPSTRHCVRLLAPQAGEHILDACAAPGGKSVAMIGETAGDIHLLATDAAEHRLAPLRENLLRAGGKDVTVAAHDWTQPCPQEWQHAFDAVLLDVPCSNSGVLQRRVDARWRLEEAEFARLAFLQGRILEAAASAVKPGGRLVYSTCSIDREEDRAVVDAFLAGHPEFHMEEDYLALPHREQADGAYAARMRRGEA